MKRSIACILIFCLVLSGCSGLLDGRYVSVTPHQEQSSQTEEEIVSVSNYDALLQTIRGIVEDGAETGIISVARYDQDRVDRDTAKAVEHIMTADPIGTYAVAEITYDLGTNAGQPAVALNISYIHDRSEIRKIQRPEDWAQAETAIAQALDNCETGIVLYIQDFEEMDFAQWVSYYATANPDKVMELPEVTANLYPETGAQRVVELKFTYQNSRDSLRAMQSAVERLFTAAAIYADGEGDERERFFKLYSFLMGLSPQFQLETSITPAYSLLQHGVGDSRAFATVYAAVCVQAQLECITVTGTKAGEPWYWNIICCDGVYYHIDLLECNMSDEFTLREDGQMSGYVWDYSAYPVCGIPPETETEE